MSGIVARAVAHDRRVLDQKDAMTVTAVVGDQPLDPVHLGVGEVIRRGGVVARFERHEKKVIARARLGDLKIRLARGDRRGGFIKSGVRDERADLALEGAVAVACKAMAS